MLLTSPSQNWPAMDYGSSKTRLMYYMFDVLILALRDVMGEPLLVRRSHKVWAIFDEGASNDDAICRIPLGFAGVVRWFLARSSS